MGGSPEQVAALQALGDPLHCRHDMGRCLLAEAMGWMAFQTPSTTDTEGPGTCNPRDAEETLKGDELARHLSRSEKEGRGEGVKVSVRQDAARPRQQHRLSDSRDPAGRAGLDGEAEGPQLSSQTQDCGIAEPSPGER